MRETQFFFPRPSRSLAWAKPKQCKARETERETTFFFPRPSRSRPGHPRRDAIHRVSTWRTSPAAESRFIPSAPLFWLDVQAHPSNTLPQRRPKMVFSPLYGTFRPHFSSEKWPWIGNSIPWIGESMGWKWISMRCFGQGAAWMGGNLAKRRTTVGVRFNGLPYSAQGFAALPAAAAGAEKRGATFRNGAPLHGIYIEMKKLFLRFVLLPGRRWPWLFYLQM